MLAGITPSAELTGGPFYDGHSIDVGLIADLAQVALRFVQEKVRTANPTINIKPRRKRP